VDPLAWKDADKIVRINAHLLVYEVQPNFKRQRLAAIGKLIDDPETAVRIAAVRGIGSIGPEAKEFVPRLKKAVDDDDKVIIMPCIWALGEIGPAAAPALSSLVAIHKDAKHPLYKPAEDAIEKIKGLKKKDAPK
jgi:HEAT repeat protein